MAYYLLIESRDPFECQDVNYYYDLAGSLAAEAEGVTLFLVQNGVLPARQGAEASGLAAVIESGVSVCADDFSLRERAIGTDQLAGGIRAAPLDEIIDTMAAGHKVLWH